MERIPKGIIKSEDPTEHWSFLNVTDKVVLDLGCGINSEFTPTPWHFLQNNKAKKVIGVDSDPNSYRWFNDNYLVKDFLPIMDKVDRHEKITMYFDYFKPEVVKMDIEGSEIHLMSVDDFIFTSIKQIGIEYHNFTCLLAVESKLQKLNYNIEYYKFEHLDIDYQGVIYGYVK